jgi:hypothetical protein
MADKKTGAKKPTKTKKQLAAEAKEAEAKLLADSEAQLVEKYGDKVVPGTVRRARKGSSHEGRLTVEIRTKGIDGEYDGQTRRVATSDVFQVNHTEVVAAELRRAARNERARAKRAAAREAKEAETATV